MCFLLPLLWAGFGWMPAQVKMEMKGGEAPAIVADGTVLHGEEYGAWGEGTAWRFYLREGMGVEVPPDWRVGRRENRAH